MKNFFLILTVSMFMISCTQVSDNHIEKTENHFGTIEVGDAKSLAMDAFNDAYVANDMSGQEELFAENAVANVNGQETTPATMMEGFLQGHNFYSDIQNSERATGTFVLDNGEIYTNTWFDWKGTSNATGKNKQADRGSPCELKLIWASELKETTKVDQSDMLEIRFESKNTIEEIALLRSEGSKIEVKAQVRNIEKIENGIIIVVPSSTPNMSDELIYEGKIKDLNYASAIIYGADPRFSSKFSINYTSSMIMYDVIAFLNELEKKYAKPKDIILMGSSTGSLAIFKAGWQKYRNTFSVMKNISKVFMINAACPDTFEGELNKDIMIYAINGKDDDSTPGWVCNNLKKSKNYSNIILLSYDGAHHFESDHYGKTKFEAKGKHILPTCSINYKKNLHSVIKVRNSDMQRDAEVKGFNKEHRKWVYRNCLKEGNYQGYDKKGAADFWKDVRSIIKDKAQPQELIGFTK